jgi:hypothetical protein
MFWLWIASLPIQIRPWLVRYWGIAGLSHNNACFVEQICRMAVQSRLFLQPSIVHAGLVKTQALEDAVKQENQLLLF